jgi:hypothetical protein
MAPMSADSPAGRSAAPAGTLALVAAVLVVLAKAGVLGRLAADLTGTRVVRSKPSAAPGKG